MKVYLDAVSTTNVNKDVLDTYKKLLDKYYCNSDALYDDGVAIYDMQEKSRNIICELLGIKKNELIFTAGASEANSLAIKGLAFKHPERKHLITSIYEHSSAYNSFKQLQEQFGYEVTYLMPDENGQITKEAVKKALRDDTLLVSIMCVNNEIGVMNNINEIGQVVKKHSGTYFHSDITQALGKVDIDLTYVDMASFSAHKIHGLKGSGGLIKKEFVELSPIISGGQQEFSLRGGTSNALVNIVLAKTIRIALENKDKYHNYLNELNKRLIDGLTGLVKINTYPSSLNTLINVTSKITSEVLLNALNQKGIMVSSKSTCGSRKNELNRTLGSMDIDEDYSIRISFDYTNTIEEIDYFITCLKEILDKYA
ncbi:MAG: cysteine desulfurase family protein [Erysipelotrichaceae bacterium]|nr:cysteine desulfurase family protein [Erysipelotrichaceae bacterium]